MCVWGGGDIVNGFLGNCGRNIGTESIGDSLTVNGIGLRLMRHFREQISLATRGDPNPFAKSEKFIRENE